MIGTTTMVILASALLARADPAADKLTTAGMVEFAAAYQAWDGAGFGRAAELFRQAAEKTPDSVTNHYWRGAALFHQMLRLRNPPGAKPEPKAADAAMNAAVTALATAVRLDSGHAESHALLGTLYGMKINGSLLRAIRYGPAVQAHQEQALKSGPSNPRVRYLLGTGQLLTAKDAAARREALNTLQAAEKLYITEAQRPAKPFEPRWGYSSCLTFAARACEMLENKVQALEYYRKALAAQPANHVAKEGITRLTGP